MELLSAAPSATVRAEATASGSCACRPGIRHHRQDPTTDRIQMLRRWLRLQNTSELPKSRISPAEDRVRK